MKIEKEVEETLRNAAWEHLLWVMSNKGQYLESHNMSTVQYMNERQLMFSFKFNSLVVKQLKKLDKNSAFLNIGPAAGLLEYANKVMGDTLTICSVEWDEQYLCCEKIRNVLGINIGYICNNVIEDNFEIFNIENYFDYVVLQRFFPIYHTNTSYRIDDVLTKMSPYGKKALIVESDGNWSKEQFEHIKSISEERIQVSGDWYLFVVDLERYK